MPMTQIYLRTGKPSCYRRALADGVQKAMATIRVPDDERFQIIVQLDEDGLIFDPGFRNISRSNDFVIILITMKAGRSDKLKQSLYQAIVDELGRDPGVRSEDIMVVLRENSAGDWSFGNGLAQLLS
jgi:phenylpyruvate tautomerase PptA (4-oxalocrotonate tautomerase family)